MAARASEAIALWNLLETGAPVPHGTFGAADREGVA